MLQAVAPSSYSLRTRLLKTDEMTDTANHNDALDGSDDDDSTDKGGRSKSRRELPAGAVATLKAWLLSPEHFTHPYPTPQDQVMLMQKTGIDKKQLKNWFTNARRRIWKPMLKKQLEQGKLTATGAGGGGVAVPGVVPGLMVPTMPGGIAGQAEGSLGVHYQQHPHGQMQQPQQLDQHQVRFSCSRKDQLFLEVSKHFCLQIDAYGNPVYLQQPPPQPVAQPQQQYSYDQPSSVTGPLTLSSSVGSLPPLTPTASGQQLSKTDSHAVLMELFARDQDLVRQATESAAKKAAGNMASGQPEYQQGQPVAGQQQGQQVAQPTQQVQSQHPMKNPSQGRLVNVPTLNSWPHFSSISSLNNLGTMPGVKSITSLSGFDLASQGPVNRVGNLAQVKSVESMGKNDSYAFLEVFFGDRSSTNLSSFSKEQRVVKRERDEDNDVGLSLEDESPSMSNVKQDSSGNVDAGSSVSDMNPTPFMSSKDNDSTGTLKRAYDDALAARGLISVSRSCEKLTDLALPAKIQRTLSQEYLRQQQQSQAQGQQYGQFQYTSAPANNERTNSSQNQSHQYPGQHPGQQQQVQQPYQTGEQKSFNFMSDPSDTNASVEVPSATKCALCHQTNVDTQLRPCGHMFHERCLKPSLQAPMGPPKCPVDHIPMQSALLAIPTDEVSISHGD